MLYTCTGIWVLTTFCSTFSNDTESVLQVDFACPNNDVTAAASIVVVTNRDDTYRQDILTSYSLDIYNNNLKLVRSFTFDKAQDSYVFPLKDGGKYHSHRTEYSGKQCTSLFCVRCWNIPAWNNFQPS